MELYCIKSHSQGIVIKGNIYNAISDKCPCKCKAYDIGSRADINEDGICIEFMDIVECASCGVLYPNDHIDWVLKDRFIPIDSINIEEAIECINELQLT